MGILIQIFALLQEKQQAKIKERLDKHVKNKLIEFCDMLDIPVARATARKVIL